MEYVNDITINEAVIHVLNNNSDEPILNEYKLDLNEEVYSFLYKHIKNTLNDEKLKYALFNDEKNIVKEISQEYLNGNSDFIKMSQEIAKQLFFLMRSKGSIASCDLFIISISTEYGPLLAILKMDYIKNYMHKIEFIDGKTGIGINPQFNGLPSNKRIDKAAFIKPIRKDNKFNLMVMDKDIKSKASEEYGSRYFINNFLSCSLVNNERDLTRGFLEAAERWTRVNLRENAEAQEELRRNIKRALDEEELIKVEDIAEKMFEDTVTKESFIKAIDEEINEKVITVDKGYTQKKFKKLKLKIDSDIEILISEDAYKDNSKFEIIKNGDGSIHMMVKHISNYVQK